LFGLLCGCKWHNSNLQSFVVQCSLWSHRRCSCCSQKLSVAR
jgi:hypothetical protein